MNQKNHTPFLDCRRVNNDPAVFQLGSNAIPVSIRDQMIRAHLFIKQAIGEGILGTDKEFLVVGAGMAGVCAAMAAAKMMILTTLIEMNEDILCRQAEAISRLVATTQYGKRSELPVSGRRAREPRGRDVTARTRELSPGESSRDTARKPAQTLERAYDPISFHTEAYDSLRSEFFIRGDGLASRRDVEPSRATLPIGA